MSLSSADHYAVWKAKQNLQSNENWLEEQEEELESRRRGISSLQESLEAARQELAQAEMDKDEQEMHVSNAREELEVANAMADNHVQPSKHEQVVDPTTGLPQGETIKLLAEHVPWMEAIQEARGFMEAGDLEQTRTAERKATELYHSLDRGVDPHAVGIPSAFQVNAASFIAPSSIASDEELSKTFEYAREHANATSSNRSRHQLMWDQIEATLGLGVSRSYPKGVNKFILGEIREQRHELEERHQEERQQQRQDEEEMEEDDEEDCVFEMNEGAWEAIKTAIRNRVAHTKTLNSAQLALPRPNSAPIARYNPSGHFAFKSEEANSSVDDLLDALCCGTLWERPTKFLKESNERVRRPFELGSSDIKCLDIDGDMMAMCGDLYSDSVMDTHTYVGCMPTPCLPTNLDSAKSLMSLKDSEGNHCFPDMNVVYEDGNGPHKQHFSCVAADADGKRIWASSRSALVRAFTTVEDVSKYNRAVAMLSFDEQEIEAQFKYVYPRFNIVKCGDSIVGSGNTGRLSVWNMQTAVEEYLSSPQYKQAKGREAERSSQDSDSDEESETDMEVDCEHGSKRRKTVSYYAGMAPKILQVEQEGFDCGDLQWLGGGSNQLLIAPSRTWGGSMESPKSSSMRLFDLAAESVVGLFVGNQGDVSIEKQFCVESHNLVFSMDGGTGFVWDVRTFKPAFALHTDKMKGQILGVPASSPVAFTFNDGSESISCWDLRMPASHAYTMATGNTHVTSMLWHEVSSSLIASVRSDHKFTYGAYGRKYRYGDPSSDVEDDNAWPSRAIHEPTYFGATPWHLSSPSLLQYAFETGRKTV